MQVEIISSSLKGVRITKLLEGIVAEFIVDEDATASHKWHMWNYRQ